MIQGWSSVQGMDQGKGEGPELSWGVNAEGKQELELSGDRGDDERVTTEGGRIGGEDPRTPPNIANISHCWSKMIIPESWVPSVDESPDPPFTLQLLLNLRH